MNKHDDRIIAVCEHVLAGAEISYVSNCGGHWSITCENDINYEDNPAVIKFAHFRHVKNLNPDARLILSLPLNSCLCKEGELWVPDYESYEDNSVKQVDYDFECANPTKTEEILDTDCYVLIRNSLVATQKISDNFEVLLLFTSRNKAEKYGGKSGDFRTVNNSNFNWIYEKTPMNVIFFTLDSVNDRPMEVHLLNYQNCIQIRS